MAIRKVVQVGDEVLRQKCFPVEKFDENLWQLLDDMKETVRYEEGAGLAAPQVGVLRRAVVCDVEEGFFEFVNPRFLKQKGEQSGPEGCLSIPDISGNVVRSQKIIIRYTDPETIETVRDTVEGYTAVIFQHEADHLDGILFTDKVVNTGPGQ